MKSLLPIAIMITAFTNFYACIGLIVVGGLAYLIFSE